VTIWSEEVEPVLRAIATAKGGRLADGLLGLGRGSGRAREALGLELDEADIYRAILLLMDEGYIEGELKDEFGPEPSAHVSGLRVTGRGQQALGEWPRFELLTTPSTLALMLEQLAEQVSPDDQGPLRKAAAYLRSLSVETVRTAVVMAGVTLARDAAGLS
jgi:hypothetical protein